MRAALTPRFAVPRAIGAEALAGFDPGAAIIDLAGETMGTRWRVRYAGSAGRAAALEGLVQRRLDGVVAEMSHWLADSLLSRFNRSTAGSWTNLPPDFAHVIAAGFAIAEASGGAFDPAIGRLTDLWGIGATPRDLAPSGEAIAAALDHSGWRRLAFDGGARRLRQPGGVWLDLSGIAKGYAVDAVSAVLGGAGVGHALVEIGGECAGRGMRPDGDPWWVELETPRGIDLPPLRVAAHALGIATSGDYVRGAHTLDPRTGRPPVAPPVAISVIHPSCMIADAWASALVVLGKEEAQSIAAGHKLAVRTVDRDGSEWLSPAFGDMLAN